MIYNINKGWPLPIYRSSNPDLSEFCKNKEDAREGFNREEEKLRDTTSDFASIEGSGP
jgi:hypothetical protein